ncbi:hypothetical protein [Patulibacter americanus]|uniref:hypothetical protein n=1 Tax=Patulibacter americanus TaxID=588672 RepID=UPI0003B796A3|nr:hypothetical protein [Patulibacter americanus]
MSQFPGAPRRALVVSAVLACTVAPGVAAAQSGRLEPKSPAAARALEESQQALDLINRADAAVRAARKACRWPSPDRGSRITHDAPGAEVTGAIAALRRPQTDADRIPEDGRLPGMGDDIYVDHTRTVTAPNGKQFVIVPARATPPTPRPASCADAVHARLLRTTATSSRRLRSRTLKTYAAVRRQERRFAEEPREPYDEVFLFARAADGGLGGGGGGGRFGFFLTHGNVMSTGGDDRSQVTGLVPDGVASVEMTFPKRVSRGAYYKPTVFPRREVVTAPVQEGVFSVRVPRGAGDAFASRTVWRAADGHVVRVVRR